MRLFLKIKRNQHRMKLAMVLAGNFYSKCVKLHKKRRLRFLLILIFSVILDIKNLNSLGLLTKKIQKINIESFIQSFNYEFFIQLINSDLTLDILSSCTGEIFSTILIAIFQIGYAHALGGSENANNPGTPRTPDETRRDAMDISSNSGSASANSAGSTPAQDDADSFYAWYILHGGRYSMEQLRSLASETFEQARNYIVARMTSDASDDSDSSQPSRASLGSTDENEEIIRNFDLLLQAALEMNSGNSGELGLTSENDDSLSSPVAAGASTRIGRNNLQQVFQSLESPPSSLGGVALRGETESSKSLKTPKIRLNQEEDSGYLGSQSSAAISSQSEAFSSQSEVLSSQPEAELTNLNTQLVNSIPSTSSVVGFSISDIIN